MAAAVGLVLEASLNAAAHFPWSSEYGLYVLLISALTLAAAAAIGGLAAVLAAPPAWALAAWVGWTWAVNAPGGVGESLVLAGAAAGVVLATLRLRGDRPLTLLGSGVAVALTVSLASSLLPRIFGRLDLVPSSTVLRQIVLLGLLGLLVATHSRWARRCPPGRGSREAMVSLCALALVVVTSPLFAEQIEGRHSRSAPPVATAAAAPASGLPHVLVLVLDTVGAEHLSAYGYQRPTSPHLERFVEEGGGALYPLAFSPASWTLPAHASLFTGELPSTHGLHSGALAGGGGRVTRPEALSVPTMAERLGAAGYATGAVFANPLPSIYRGLQNGFQTYLWPRPPRPLRVPGEGLRRAFAPWILASAVRATPEARTVNRELLRLVDGCGERPCFLVANYMDAHGPYTPPRWVAGRFSGRPSGPPPLRARMDDPPATREHAEARYDEQILALDREVGELLDALEERGFLDRAWTVITSDHGEAFGDHGVVRHGTSVFNDQVRIPLIVRPPAGERLTPTTQAVDLLDVTATLTAATVGEKLGIGRDLRRPGEPVRSVQVEFYGNFGDTDVGVLGPIAYTPARSAVLDGWKLIELAAGGVSLFHLESDLFERRDLAAERSEVAERLAASLPPLTPAREGGGDAALGRDEVETLRALGYLE